MYIHGNHGKIKHRADDTDDRSRRQCCAEIVGRGDVVCLNTAGEERAAGNHGSIRYGRENIPGNVAAAEQNFCQRKKNKNDHKTVDAAESEQAGDDHITKKAVALATAVGNP